MKTMIAVALITGLSVTAFASGEDKEGETYRKIELKDLKLDPEAHEKEDVTYRGVFLDISSRFPAFMEDSGFDGDDHYRVSVGDEELPLIVEQDSDLGRKFRAMKRHTPLNVYGTVREFDVHPRLRKDPAYYLEPKRIEVLGEPVKGKRHGPHPRPRRRW
ncbi:hypothetical protein [Kiritimatiella glycovorans]|uniref:Uncharacterized protein n=1 Tax=Kiritimatiella glycovorans TaxID=1307763 RepID=A0A0G3EGG8_9BACT|nr:hypothetical protein [Kiritimatiella glycovorans]AKJ64507.1 hypothetical protein L21SP4_01259 [Kiritimatiella glycovorans]